MLHAVWHGTEALVYSDHPREAAASTGLATIFGFFGVNAPEPLLDYVLLIRYYIYGVLGQKMFSVFAVWTGKSQCKNEFDFRIDRFQFAKR